MAEASLSPVSLAPLSNFSISEMGAFEVTGVVLAVPGVIELRKQIIIAIKDVRCALSPRTMAVYNDAPRPRTFPKVLQSL